MPQINVNLTNLLLPPPLQATVYTSIASTCNANSSPCNAIHRLAMLIHHLAMLIHRLAMLFIDLQC